MRSTSVTKASTTAGANCVPRFRTTSSVESAPQRLGVVHRRNIGGAARWD